jgi:5'(3')-deoxyribonucleotidase
MEHRTELHDALGERECRCSRLEIVLAEEDRPIGPVDTNQPFRGVLDVAEDGFRELVGEYEVFVVCSAIQPPVVRGDLAVALRTHR